jgi:hypothetical protein
MRDNLLQEIRLFTNYFVCDLIRKKKDALQPTRKAQQHLIVLVLFFQELNGPSSPLLRIHRQGVRTSNVTLATPKTAFAIGFN